MLHDFLTSNRMELIERCRAKVSRRRAPRATPRELEYGVPLFLAQLAEMLPGGSVHPDADTKAPEARSTLAESQIGEGATRHGKELLRHDFTIEQVVHDYGDLCQSITELAVEQHAPITVHEFGILNIRLDNAIAGAVSEYARQHDLAIANGRALPPGERLGVLAHGMRNLLNTSILAVTAIKRGNVGFGGATGAALDRSLIGMREMIDHALAEVRLEESPRTSREAIEIGPFIADVQVASALEALRKGCELTVSAVEPGIFVEADRHILASAVANLLQYAFKFTREDGHILLRAHASGGRVFIEVEENGDLPQEIAEELCRPLEEHRAGGKLEAGLRISSKAVAAIGGSLYHRRIEGRGCVFIIEFPQSELPQQRDLPQMKENF